ncbi:MAG: 2-oxo acid dehydrogenase subunit E2 [Candidatus Bathyarchaeota archaeon]|nr:2-oxo acid dehydrogenase subunit E2 [Candidatus Bathyarchaeota archaeon]
MVVEIIMPKLGQTMEKGKILRWLKKEGERVEKGEPLLEVETDKAVLEVESRSSGILKRILAHEGEIVSVAKVIGYIAEEGEPLPQEAPQESVAAAETGAPTPLQAVGAPEEMGEKRLEREIKASPLARKIARERGVDLTQVVGTGPGGRITEKDVLDYLAKREAAKPAPPPTSAPAAVSIVSGREAAVVMPEFEGFQVIPISGMRSAIARKMTYSKTNIPHFYISVEVDMTEAARLREELIPIIETKTGVRLSFTHMLVKAVAMALREYPQLNALCDGESIKISKDINIGIAVGLEDGLIVPVLRKADSLDLAQIASKTESLITKAREKRLSEDEFTGGTFTISNLGVFEVDSFTAIINPPEVAILAVGRIRDKPVVVGGEVKVRKMMNITLSADHRAVDGLIAAKFLGRVKELLEKPFNLLFP